MNYLTARAEKLQLVISTDDFFHIEDNLPKMFKSAFGVTGEHLFLKLMEYDNVAEWLEMLNQNNAKIFFESEYFNDLN